MSRKTEHSYKEKILELDSKYWMCNINIFNATELTVHCKITETLKCQGPQIKIQMKFLRRLQHSLQHSLTATQVTCLQPTWNSLSVTNRFSSIRPYLYIESQEYRLNRVFQSIRLSYLLGRIPNTFIGTPVRDTSTDVHKFLKTFSYGHILLIQSKLTMVTISTKDPRC